MQLRLVRQVKSAVEEKQKPDNYIYPDRLSSLEQRMLKEIFKKITSLQSQLNYDFMGGI